MVSLIFPSFPLPARLFFLRDVLSYVVARALYRSTDRRDIRSNWIHAPKDILDRDRHVDACTHSWSANREKEKRYRQFLRLRISAVGIAPVLVSTYRHPWAMTESIELLLHYRHDIHHASDADTLWSAWAIKLLQFRILDQSRNVLGTAMSPPLDHTFRDTQS